MSNKPSQVENEYVYEPQENEVPREIVKNIIAELTPEEATRVSETISQITLNPEWYKEYEELDDPDTRKTLEHLFGYPFAFAAGLSGVIVLAAAEGNPDSWFVQKQRRDYEAKKENIPLLIELITVPSDLPQRMFEKGAAIGDTLGDTLMDAIVYVKEEIMENEAESNLRKFLNSEGILHEK